MWNGAPIFGSITDQHFRGWTRVARRSGACARAASGRRRSRSRAAKPVYGLGEKFGPLDKRGQLVHSQVEDALGVNTGLSYKNTPFAWSPGTGNGAWGVFVHTPGMVTHGVGHPDWSHRSYAMRRRRRSARPVPVRRDTPGRHPRPLHAAHRPRARRAALEPRPVGLARVLQDARRGDRRRREAARAQDSLRRADARRARRVERRHALRLSSGTPSASPIRAPRSRRSSAHNLRVCVWEYPYVSVHSPAVRASSRRAATCFDDRGRRSVRVRAGTRRRQRARSATC